MKRIRLSNLKIVMIAGMIISVCAFWIVRLELHAEALASRVDELHNSLKNNQDKLDFLDEFERGVKNNSIYMNGNMIELRSYLTAMGLTDKGITMQLGDSWFYLDDKGVAISRGKNNESLLTVTNDGVKIKVGTTNEFFIEANSKGDNITLKKGESKLQVGKVSTVDAGGSSSTLDGIALGENNTGTIAVAKGNGIALKTKDKNEIRFAVDDKLSMEFLPQEEKIVINKGDSQIIVGNATTTGGGLSSHEGVLLGEANTGTIGVAKNEGIGLRTKDKNDISIKVDDEFYVSLLPKIDRIVLKKDDFQIQMGKTSVGEGIAIGDLNTASFAIAKGKGLAMKAAGKNYIKISGENDFFLEFDGSVNIKAKGDINLKSENGDINLKGKNINLNE